MIMIMIPRVSLELHEYASYVFTLSPFYCVGLVLLVKSLLLVKFY